MNDTCTAEIRIWPEFLDDGEKARLIADGKIAVMSGDGEYLYRPELDGSLSCLDDGFSGAAMVAAYMARRLPFLVKHEGGDGYGPGMILYGGKGDPLLADMDPDMASLAIRAEILEGGKLVLSSDDLSAARRIARTMAGIARRRRTIREKTGEEYNG